MITVGIDEVGRGCWAGPLVAGAVILPLSYLWEVKPPKGGAIGVEKTRLLPGQPLPEGCPPAIRDSKKMTKKQRETAAAWIHKHALAVGLGWVEPREIDTVGLTRAVTMAMERALAKITAAYDEIIIDGNINYLQNVRGSTSHTVQAVVKADDSVLAVSAASIVAKVARDNYMANLGEKYASYGFGKHVGYGTAAHIAALERLGICDLHRRSYKPIMAFL